MSSAQPKTPGASKRSGRFPIMPRSESMGRASGRRARANASTASCLSKRPSLGRTPPAGQAGTSTPISFAIVRSYWRPAPSHWSLLFDVPGRPAAQRAKRIDGRLPASLINLPQAISGDVDDDAYRSLARDLQRGQATGLPSGEAVARERGVEPLSAAECGLAEHGWDGETPLWLYILREASARHDGDRLGEVGGLIVGEVLVGIVDADPERLSRRRGGLAADTAERRARPLHAQRPPSGAGARSQLSAAGEAFRSRRPDWSAPERAATSNPRCGRASGCILDGWPETA
jgi:hypothetical protein